MVCANANKGKRFEFEFWFFQIFYLWWTPVVSLNTYSSADLSLSPAFSLLWTLAKIREKRPWFDILNETGLDEKMSKGMDPIVWNFFEWRVDILIRNVSSQGFFVFVYFCFYKLFLWKRFRLHRDTNSDWQSRGMLTTPKTLWTLTIDDVSWLFNHIF